MRIPLFFRLFLAMTFVLGVVGSAHGAVSRWEPLTQQLVADGFDPAAMRALFARPEVVYKSEYMGKKIRALHNTKYGAPKPKAKPARQGPRERRTLHDVHMTPSRLAAIRILYHEYAEALDHVEAHYGAPREVVMAILLIETRVGEYLGDQTALNALAGMAATRELADISGFIPADLPADRRRYLQKRLGDKAAWAYTQLKALLRFTARNNLDPATLPGSIYGAFGLCQFIPTTALERAVDGDRDGRIDLFDPADAIPSVANFLKKSGWKKGLSREREEKVIRRYNNDAYYARVVMQLADRL